MALVSYGRRVSELAARDPDAVALVHEGVDVTRGALEASANRLARRFAELGVEAGDRVTYALPNGIEHCRVSLAAWKLGAVPNPVSPGMPDPEREAIVARADPALCVGFASAGRPSLAAGAETDPARSDAPLPDVTPPHERALASGGSTGAPKLIVPSNPAAYDPENPSPIFRARTAALVPGPLTHAVPFSACWQAIFAGAHAVLMTRFDAADALALIEAHRVDRVCLVPTMMLRIWRLPDAERGSRDLSSLEFVMSGGAPLPAWLMRAWIDWLGPDVMHEAFGPSERIGGTFITGREWLAHPGSVGRPSAGSRLRILHPETGAELPPGELGEIYWMPAGGTGSTYQYRGAEARRTADGWESVGDMGWLDEDGYLYLGDRRSDMILVGGRNVYPAEVEAALVEHPAVRSSCVIGLPEEDLGSRIHALVELAQPISDETLLAHLRERLAAYKLPHSIERCDHPLRDDAGKVRRAALRAERIREPG
jgi:bile acid-coenzyme A ligase